MATSMTQDAKVVSRPILKLDLPVLINLNARSLSSEKVVELQVTVEYHNASVVCLSESWFKEYMDNVSLKLHGFSL